MESPIAKNVTDNQKKSRQNKKICRELEKEVASSPQKSREAKKRSRESKKKARGQKKSRCPFQATVAGSLIEHIRARNMAMASDGMTERRRQEESETEEKEQEAIRQTFHVQRNNFI